MNFQQLPAADDGTPPGLYQLVLYDGDKQTDPVLKRCTTAVPAPGGCWGSGSRFNLTSSSNKVLITRQMISPGGPPDWSMQWTSHWKPDWHGVCKPAPPSETTALMGPATIGKFGVELSNGSLFLTPVHYRFGEIRSCGDHVTQINSGETCDSGQRLNTNQPVEAGIEKSSVCRPNCQQAKCGDSVVDADEQCDDGDTNFACNLASTVDTAVLPLPAGVDISVALSPSRYDGLCDDVHICGAEPNGGEFSSVSYELNECLRQWDPQNGNACADTSQDCLHQITNELTTPGDRCNPESPSYSPTVVSACRATCMATVGATVGEPLFESPAFCRKVNSMRPGSCRPNCRFPRCGDGVQDPADPSGQERWQAEECDPGNPALGIPKDPPTGMCSPTCVACEQSGNVQLLQQSLENGQAFGSYNLTLCEDAVFGPFPRGCADSAVCSSYEQLFMEAASSTPPTSCASWTPAQLSMLNPPLPLGTTLLQECPTSCGVPEEQCNPAATPVSLTIPFGHAIGIVCVERNCKTKKFGAHFDIAGSLYMSHIAITGASAVDGGAIATTGASAAGQIESCNFAQNQASGNGGALSVPSGHVTVLDTTFQGNHADRKGGAVYVAADGVIIMTNVRFIGNTAGTFGGAIYLDTPTDTGLAPALQLRLSGATFTGPNTAGPHGGSDNAFFDISSGAQPNNADATALASSEVSFPSGDGH